MVNMRDNGEITDEGEFSHKAPLAGPPRPFKHGGKAVGGYVRWGARWKWLMGEATNRANRNSNINRLHVARHRFRSCISVIFRAQVGAFWTQVRLDPWETEAYVVSNIQPIGNGLVVAQLG